MEHDTKTEKKSKRTGTPPNLFTHLLTTAHWFDNKLKEKAGAKSITIDDVRWYDIPNKDASLIEVIIGDEKVKHTISDLDLLNDKPDRFLEQLIDEFVDGRIAKP